MALIEQIQKNVAELQPIKQIEVLNFIVSLKQQAKILPFIKPRSLKDHAAFGSWQSRKVDAIHYQQKLRAEWND